MSVEAPVMAEQQNPLSADDVEPPQLPTTAIAAQSKTSGSNILMYKNWLQEFAARASLQFPVYRTVNEGAPHDPKFRSTVTVNGMAYTSPHTFSQRKNAEQDAARIALECVTQKLKNESCLLIREDSTFCKSILNEYAAKMHLTLPSYQTKIESGLLPVFVSSVDFNGVSYTGNKGRNKKEAKQLAARDAILSILDSGGESLNMMVAVIRSKIKLYAVTSKSNDSSSMCGVAVSAVTAREDLLSPLNKRKEAEIISSIVNISGVGVSESTLDVFARMQPAHLPIHHFKKHKEETTSTVVVPSIEFVPSGSEPAVVPPISTAKKNRKKKGKRRLQIGPEMPVGLVPMTEITPSVTQ
ncbi:OLC1v1010641C1 [Oldenlandia corymbosa var. corymbosa]|uniref:OLC1v1010641C1 n=1 Tax=Oldenlandia corymbosa var. corymbosa TaxID=529605 RepID=A0AAV1DU56_OLDCO|nr:OLC1v1010641C1 [Oldenlandia corymbosa var. corymbosa]